MLGWLLSLFCQPSKPVNTRDEALNIAQTAIYKKWGQYDYSSFEQRISYNSESDVWHFRYMHKDCHNMFGGIGPGVEIRGSDGKVLKYLKGQK